MEEQTEIVAADAQERMREDTDIARGDAEERKGDEPEVFVAARVHANAAISDKGVSESQEKKSSDAVDGGLP